MSFNERVGTNSQPWMSPAAFCASHPHPDLWFPAGRYETAARAEALCGSCPVRTACLRYAIADPTLEGIYGGTTTKQRADLRKKNRKAA